jgi:hypothetical protein
LSVRIFSSALAKINPLFFLGIPVLVISQGLDSSFILLASTGHLVFLAENMLESKSTEFARFLPNFIGAFLMGFLISGSTPEFFSLAGSCFLSFLEVSSL